MNQPTIYTSGTTPLDAEPMRPRQVAILTIAVLLSTLDGFDALSMALVAPAVGQQWHLGKAVLGLLLSSSLVGMAFGSLLLSPLGDRLGRRPMVLICLAVMTLGSLASALAKSALVLALSRGLTGIGIGTMVVMTTLISAEFTSSRYRSLAIAAVATVGFPLGGILSGLAAAAILKSIGWPYMFILGALAGGLLLLLLFITLPESPAHLVARRTTASLSKANSIVRALGHSVSCEMPLTQAAARSSYATLFAGGNAGTTLRLMVINILISTAAYYLLSWMPQLIADMGFPITQSSLIVGIAHIGSLVGGLAMGFLAARILPSRVAVFAVIGLALSIAAIGLTPRAVAPVLISSTAFSLFLAGTTGMLYVILAASFPPVIRSSGVGFVMGSGRIASSAGPALAGWMFASGLTRGTVSLTFAAGPLIAALLLAGLARRQGGKL